MISSYYSFIQIKPDGLARGLSDDIKSIYLDNGFDIVESNIVQPTRAQMEEHLGPATPEYFERAGKKTLSHYQHFRGGTAGTFIDGMCAVEIGKLYRELIIDYAVSGPVENVMLFGTDAINRVHALSGDVLPELSKADTIRGYFGEDTHEKCVAEKRTIHNIIHTPDSLEEADRQIRLWFPERYRK